MTLYTSVRGSLDLDYRSHRFICAIILVYTFQTGNNPRISIR